MSNAITQYYPNSEELKNMRSLLPKKDSDGTAAAKIAKMANKSTSTVYKVLKDEFKNEDVLHACCRLIIEDCERKKAKAISFMQKLQGTDARV